MEDCGMNTVWPWTRARLTSLRPTGTALLFNRVLCLWTDGEEGASPYWLPQFSWKSEQHQSHRPPPSHMALATTPRRQLPGNQTMLEPVAVVWCACKRVCVLSVMHLRSEMASREQRECLSLVQKCSMMIICKSSSGVSSNNSDFLWRAYKEIILD